MTQTNKSYRSLVRSIIALGNGPLESLQFAKAHWPGDRMTVECIEKGAVVPESTTQTTSLTGTAVSRLISLIGPMSASGRIFNRGIQLNLDRSSSILLPSITQAATGIAFIAQGSPFPIKQLALSSASLGVKKLAMGVVMTRELMEGSNAEVMLNAVLSENLSLGLDTLLLDAVAASTTRPAGLRNGVGATPATAGGGIDAMVKDLSNLATTVAAVAGSQENIIFVASPGEAIKIGIRTNGNFAHPVFSSAGLAAGVVLCLATNCFAVAGDDAPRFEVSDQATVHLDDSATSVSQLGIAGTPNTVAAPTRSAFQTDTKFVRLILDLNWALRTTGAVAWTETVTW